MAVKANDRTKRERVSEILKTFDLDSSAIWDCHGTPVIFHWACERIAAKAGIVFEPPQIIDRDTLNKTVTLMVSGKVGDRAEWSFGEVTKANCQNAYPWAMAEKRAKDRVTLKFAGLSGEVYSEEEADDFKLSASKKTSKAEHKRNGDFEAIKAEIEATKSPEELKAWGVANAPRVKALPSDWRDPIADVYEAHLEDLKSWTSDDPDADEMEERTAA